MRRVASVIIEMTELKMRAVKQTVTRITLPFYLLLMTKWFSYNSCTQSCVSCSVTVRLATTQGYPRALDHTHLTELSPSFVSKSEQIFLTKRIGLTVSIDGTQMTLNVDIIWSRIPIYPVARHSAQLSCWCLKM